MISLLAIIALSLLHPSHQFFFSNEIPPAPADKVCEWFGTAPFCGNSACPTNWTAIVRMGYVDEDSRYGYYGIFCQFQGYKALCCDNRVVKKDPTKHCHKTFKQMKEIAIREFEDMYCPAGTFKVAQDVHGSGWARNPKNLWETSRATLKNRNLFCCDDGTLEMTEEERLQSMKVV